MEIRMKVDMPDGQHFAITAVLSDSEVIGEKGRQMVNHCAAALAKTAIMALEAKVPQAEWPKDFLIAKLKEDELAALTEKTGIKLGAG